MSDELVRELREYATQLKRSVHVPHAGAVLIEDACKRIESLQARIAELEEDLRVTTEGSYEVLADEEEDY